IVSYGAPVLPGAMFLLGYFADGTPILVLPRARSRGRISVPRGERGPVIWTTAASSEIPVTIYTPFPKGQMG
ncbi:hypothetical protein, partial [Flavonifractor sp. An306]|uniref:hypothetical protein n=1 Tax=Flavonifractor sp. An306 TaxID=1965629 RepID=UPI000B578475